MRAKSESGKRKVAVRDGEKDGAESNKKQQKVRTLSIAKAVLKEMSDLPESIRDQFLVSLEMACLGLPPALSHEKLKSAGEGVIELRINGRPAYRCMYIVTDVQVVVLHATAKTTQGQDRQLVDTTSKRLKRLVQKK